MFLVCFTFGPPKKTALAVWRTAAAGTKAQFKCRGVASPFSRCLVVVTCSRILEKFRKPWPSNPKVLRSGSSNPFFFLAWDFTAYHYCPLNSRGKIFASNMRNKRYWPLSARILEKVGLSITQWYPCRKGFGSISYISCNFMVFSRRLSFVLPSYPQLLQNTTGYFKIDPKNLGLKCSSPDVSETFWSSSKTPPPRSDLKV